MEAISSDFVFFIVFVRDCIQICSFRHCLVECCIKYTYLWYARHDFFACFNTNQVCRVVQRCQFAAFLQCFFYCIINDNRACEIFTTMYHTMTQCIDFFHRFYNTMICICQCVQYHFYSHAVVLHIIVKNHIIFASRLMFQSRTFNTNSFAKTFCHYCFCIHINQLIFQRRTTTV